MLTKILSTPTRAVIYIKNTLNLLGGKIRFHDEVENVGGSFSSGLFFTFIFLLFLTVLALNILTPLIGDDYVYSFIYQTNDRLSSINDIVRSQQLHYDKWGGRTIVHFIDQAILYNYNPLKADILNSVAYTTFIILIYLHVVAKKVFNPYLLFILFTLVWFIQPVFAETALWITGSSNYLWGTLLILLFLLPYRLYRNKKRAIYTQVFYAALMLVVGIIAGWTNENTAAAMIIMIIAYFYYYKSQKWHIPVWAYTGLAGAIVGYTLMIIAPGNFARASEAPTLSAFLIAYRLLTYTQRFVIYLGLLNTAIIICYFIYKKTTDRTNPINMGYIIIYFIGVFVSIYTMLASPSFPARAWFGSITFNIIAFGITYRQLNPNDELVKNIKAALFFSCIPLFAASYYDAYKDTSNINNIWKEREAIITEKKSKGETSVTFKEYQAKTKFGLGDTYYALPYISKYYGIEFILEK